MRTAARSTRIRTAAGITAAGVLAGGLPLLTATTTRTTVRCAFAAWAARA